MKTKVLLALVVSGWLAWAANQNAGAAEPELAPEQLSTLVKDLGNEEFSKRQAAEAALQKAGEKAKTALEEGEKSTDPQVKASAKRLLSQIRLAMLPAVNYLEVIPANALVTLYIANGGQSIRSFKATAVGKLAESQELAGFRKIVDELLNKDPEKRKQVMTWVERFRGQIVASVWQLNILAPEDSGMGVMFEISDPDPKAVYRAFMDETGLGQAGLQPAAYKEIETLENPQGGGATALVGKNLLVAISPKALHTLIDGLLNPTGGMAKSPAFLKAQPNLGAKPELLLAIDLVAYLKLITSIMPIPGLEEMMSSSGAAEVELWAMSESVVGDSFEERFVVVHKGDPKGFQAITVVPPGAPAPIEIAAQMPPNAAAAVMSYLDGEKTEGALTQYLEGLKKLIAMQRAMNPNAAEVDFDAVIKEVETKLNAKIADLVKSVKGELALWLVVGATPIELPEVAGLLTCTDAAKAKVFSSALVSLANALAQKKVIEEVKVGERTFYELNLEEVGAIPSMPISPCWVVEGNRLYFASTTAVLQKQLKQLENKTAPSLATQQEFVKAMGRLAPDDRKGQILYADARTLLTLGATIGLPMLHAQIKDENVKKALAGLPKPQDLFKDMPPIVSASVVKGQSSVAIVKAPVPLLPTLLAAGFAVSFSAGAATEAAVEEGEEPDQEEAEEEEAEELGK